MRVEVAAASRRAAQRGQGPDRADRGQTPIFDMAMQHNGFVPLTLVGGAGPANGRLRRCAARNPSGKTLKHEVREPLWCSKHRAL
ncbi:hypothetical protein [Mycobacterium sp. E2733]|uniref:hypothetical protein n=1 Tax=Mycobacterium sp. E2733 TaxID=1834138 RepID=UPI0012EA6178|nr:hypothetical protein [Mycobacterium sp. E2733]